MTVTLENLGRHAVAIWGAGREGQAAAALIRRRWPNLPLIVADDNIDARHENFDLRKDDAWAAGVQEREKALRLASVVIKSPGISLYHPFAHELASRGVHVTSLLNLWAALPRAGKTIAITGTKGKSTTSSLIAHILQRLGKSVALIGNIGAPPGQDFERERDADFCVIEVSSYQAAQFQGIFDLVALTNLEPEHLDWHGSVARYYSDKLNLFSHARCGIVPVFARQLLEAYLPASIDRALFRGGSLQQLLWSHSRERMHLSDDFSILDGDQVIGQIRNPFLARRHNAANLVTALCALQHFSLDLRQCLSFSESYQGLPHRQQVLGERSGILFVDDSIATTPQATIAALSVWHDRPTSLIFGGFDRGIDYQPLVSYLIEHPILSAVGMGPSGSRIVQLLMQHGYSAPVCCAATMQEAVSVSLRDQFTGGLVLLSPAAPSYGLFKDFSERGEAFAKCCGF